MNRGFRTCWSSGKRFCISIYRLLKCSKFISDWDRWAFYSKKKRVQNKRKIFWNRWVGIECLGSRNNIGSPLLRHSKFMLVAVMPELLNNFILGNDCGCEIRWYSLARLQQRWWSLQKQIVSVFSAFSLHFCLFSHICEWCSANTAVSWIGSLDWCCWAKQSFCSPPPWPSIDAAQQQRHASVRLCAWVRVRLHVFVLMFWIRWIIQNIK